MSVLVSMKRPGADELRPMQGKRPIDMAHLVKQTMGDRALEQEVLTLFARQAAAVRDQMAKADPRERTFLAHTLKGSARSIGAFALADCLAEIESHPTETAGLGRLPDLVDQVRNFIAAIHR